MFIAFLQPSPSSNSHLTADGLRCISVTTIVCLFGTKSGRFLAPNNICRDRPTVLSYLQDINREMG